MEKIVIFDTNVLIHALAGCDQAYVELAYWNRPLISAISWMEVYSGADASTRPQIDTFMRQMNFLVVAIDEPIMQAAAQLRRDQRHTKKIGLPDAIIRATANIKNALLITRNTKDFQGPGIRVPYELETITTVNVINIKPPPL